MTVLYSPLQRLVVGRENETIIEKRSTGFRLSRFFFFFILLSYKELTSGENDWKIFINSRIIKKLKHVIFIILSPLYL